MTKSTITWVDLPSTPWPIDLLISQPLLEHLSTDNSTFSESYDKKHPMLYTGDIEDKLAHLKSLKLDDNNSHSILSLIYWISQISISTAVLLEYTTSIGHRRSTNYAMVFTSHPEILLQILHVHVEAAHTRDLRRDAT
jgi:hypothetical protein